jgi:hypothetical protein
MHQHAVPAAGLDGLQHRANMRRGETAFQSMQNQHTGPIGLTHMGKVDEVTVG